MLFRHVSLPQINGDEVRVLKSTRKTNAVAAKGPTLCGRRSIFPSPNRRHPKETCARQPTESFTQQKFMGTGDLSGIDLDTGETTVNTRTKLLCLHGTSFSIGTMTPTTPGEIGVLGAGAGLDALKGLMSPGAGLSVAGLCLPRGRPSPSPSKPGTSPPFLESHFLPSRSCNPSQIEYKPPHLPRLVSARALEPNTAALIVSLKTI